MMQRRKNRSDPILDWVLLN